MPKARRVVLDGRNLTITDVVDVARNDARVTIAQSARSRMRASRRVVDEIVKRQDVAYGITTGFGELAHVRIPGSQIRELQRNLVVSHAVGVGEPFPEDVVRAAMLIRANTLARGHSGVHTATVDALVAMLNAGLHPIVPSQGSLGASGDLAPLAHMTLPLIGLGHATLGGRRMTGKAAMAKAGIPLRQLDAKEGLALLNGTSFMAALAALSVTDAYALLDDAQIAGAMSVEALLGTDHAFIADVGRLRPHPGQVMVAQNLWDLTRGSKLIASHRNSAHRVQDAYALRCMPQVLGASLDVILWADEVVTREINSVTDNPIILPDGVLSAGNFHGQPLAYAMDFLAIACAEVANISERRTDRLVNPHVSELPPFLVESGGLNSGFMVAQYTAAALVSENKGLSHPASVDSIPTSAQQEDHVSMGLTAGLKLRRLLTNAATVIAIEYVCAAQALDFRAPLKPAKAARAAHATIRKKVSHLKSDRILAPDIEAARQLMAQGLLRQAVAKAGLRLRPRRFSPRPST
jgi:histidine ammonia-lyase